MKEIDSKELFAFIRTELRGDRKLKIKITIVTVVYILYVLALLFADDSIKPSIGITAIIYVGLAAWFFGPLGGVIAAALNVATYYGLCCVLLTEGMEMAFSTGAILGHLAVIVLAVIIGHQRMLYLAVKKSQYRYRRLFEEASDAVIIHDLKGNILEVNLHACDMFGYSRRDLMEMRIADLHTDEEREKSKKAFMDIAKNNSVRFESRFRRSDDTRFDVDISSRIIDRKKGIIQGIVRNISQTKKVEAELRRHRESLEKLVEERTAELLEKQGKLRDMAISLTLAEEREKRRISEMLHDYIGQNLSLIRFKVDAMLSDGKVEAEKEDVEFIKEKLAECIRDVRSLTFELSPPVLYELGLPAALDWLAENMKKNYSMDCKVNIEGRINVSEKNGVLLFQSARELLHNAAKHSGADDVTIGLRRNRDKVVLSVTDDGKGISPDHSNISARRSGFGLFSIRERVKNLGGSMKIDTAPSKGTSVTITI